MIDFGDFPAVDAPLERLSAYREHRAAEAARKERDAVLAAALKPEPERTETDLAIIGYSNWGTAAGCRCGR